jgi:(p)ppGpp synthase/HD superfamily hydrolase
MKNIAKEFAFNAHNSTNQLYNGHPYSFHLDMAVATGEKFIHLIPLKYQDNVIAGIYCHDLIEDTTINYSDIVKTTNKMVAELVYACTNEKGRNRKERANDKYYEGIRNTKYATFVKLCDRIANVSYSVETNKMLALYKKEYEHFKKMLYIEGEYEEMWNKLDELLQTI